MRMLAANTDITCAFKCDYAFLADIKRFLFEYGLMLNDRLNYRLALLPSVVSNKKTFMQLNAEINEIIAPESAGLALTQEILDEKSLALMKQLENTIVTFDRGSLNQARQSSMNERMRV